jgi:hypothetical protein
VGSYRDPIIAGIVVILAFVGGYKQNDLQALWDSQASSETQTVATSTAPKEDNKQPIPVARPAQPVQPMRATSPYAEMLKRPQGIPPRDAVAPPPNPYQETFKSTMESIRPGVIGKKQHQKRNLYFDRLREQLQELQGQPSEAVPPPKDRAAAEEEALEKERSDPLANRRNVRPPRMDNRPLPLDEEDLVDGETNSFDNDAELLDEELEDTIAEILAEETM